MKRTFEKRHILLILIIVVPLSIWLIINGLRNQKDADWAATDALLQQNFTTLDEAADSLGALYRDLHPLFNPPEGGKLATDSLALRLVSEPYLPTMEFAKFKQFSTLITDRKSVIMAGVTGSGNSTLVDRIANLLAGELPPQSPQREEVGGGHKLEILCAPQFDLDLHRRYIGKLGEKSFEKGELLKFWDKCRARPMEKFVCVIDNFDKINPETFFGPELWQRLDDPRFVVKFGKDTIQIPDNFYLLCITHAGVGSKIEMNNEHFKRFGGQVMLPPTAVELVLYLKSKKQEVAKDLEKKQTALVANSSVDNSKDTPQYLTLKKDVAKLKSQLASLNDTSNLKQFVYFFTKANALIAEKYSHGHELGQWSDVRKLFQPKDFEALQMVFINHVNAFRPQTELKKEDFDGIVFSIKNDGDVQHSSPIWRAAAKLTALGFASELGVAGSFALISGIVGWLYFRRRHQYMQDFTTRVYGLMDDFYQNRESYDALVGEVKRIKSEFDALVLTQKINYSEAAFFYGFLEDKTRTIEMAREVNESFLKLVDVFLEDDVLTDSEYAKLIQFLDSIRLKISTPQYLVYKNQIDEIHQQFGEKV